jgi:protein Tex
MEQHFILTVARELSITAHQVAATAQLLADGGTVPFIARYRKEVTGSLDEVAITAIRDRLEQLKELYARRDSILESLKERGLLTDELEAKLMAALTMTELEDIYLPYRPKRRTRAMIAREKGLEPLALLILEQKDSTDPQAAAAEFVNAEKGVENIDQALAGARDIIAEMVSENQESREKIRNLFSTEGKFACKVIEEKKAEAVKYQDYFEWTEPVASAPSHRILAMRRGEKEEFLVLRIQSPKDKATELLGRIFNVRKNACGQQVVMAIEDGYDRLLAPSMETDVRLETKKRADLEAIKIFTENLRQLLLASPLGQKNILALDPGFRTGCKVVILDKQGKLLDNDVIFPHNGEAAAKREAERVRQWCRQYQIEAVAIGNGTAGRETEEFVRSAELDKSIAIVMVNESGASVYSASDVAREEFPDYDVTVRGAVSIGRRLMDPLAELVKIDPKSIGVGQYQHDVDQPMLRQSLDDTVMSCVNNVGVEVNTASRQLLTYVAGLGPALAQKIIEYRNENGPFHSRKDMMKVPRLGAKAFEQAAGFLRIRDAQNPLDASAVHPESYPVVDRMAADLKCTVGQLIQDGSLRSKIKLEQYKTETVGLETLHDIVQELAKPGRDPRSQFEPFKFAEGVTKIEDLCPGMKLPGIATNITAFGVFVDIGVHQDGLVHISELADRFVKDPAEIIKVHQHVNVTVLSVDIARKRIALSMKTGKPQEKPAEKKDKPRPQQLKQPAPKPTGRLIDQLHLG